MSTEDAKGNHHGEDGRFVSPHQFERDQDEHAREHDEERATAEKTAQRLEREVEQTARRLERVVEETAARIERSVQAALAAVAETARVHAEAHSKEHLAHERVHSVEADQVYRAEAQQQARDKVQADALAEYKKANNEWSGTVRELTANFPQRVEQDAKFAAIEKDLRTNTSSIADLREVVLKEFSQQGGRSAGISSTAKAGYSILAAAGLILGLIATVIALTRR